MSAHDPVALRVSAGCETIEITVDQILSDVESDAVLEKLVRFGAAQLGLDVSQKPRPLFTPV